MTLLHDSPELVADPTLATSGSTAPDGVLRFRAATVEQALMEARHELGPDVEIVDANRIRRGGVGGFFATDLGVELAIRPVTDPVRASATDVVGPLPSGDPADAPTTDPDFQDRLAALDRAIYGERATSGIDRLLERASDGYERRPVPAGPATTGAVFAEHLRQASAMPPLPRRPSANDADAEVAPQPAAAPPQPAAAPPEPEVAPPELEAAPPAAAHPVPDPSPTIERTDERADEPELGHDPRPDDAVGATDPGARPIPTGPSADLGHHAELAAGAVGRLIQELGRATPTGIIQHGQLARLTVSLTAADGSSVEFAAELNGPGHG